MQRKTKKNKKYLANMTKTLRWKRDGKRDGNGDGMAMEKIIFRECIRKTTSFVRWNLSFQLQWKMRWIAMEKSDVSDLCACCDF